MQRFIDRYGLTFPSVEDAEGAIFQRFGLTYQPAWVFVDAAGNADVQQRAFEPDVLRKVLEALAAPA